METQDVNLYPCIHKGIRQALTLFYTQASETDWFDTGSVSLLHEKWNRLVALLHLHHEDEERLVHPLLTRFTPEIKQTLDSAHRAMGCYMEDLDTYFTRLESQDIDPGKKVEIGLGFCLNLNKFLVDYFAHLHFEETEAELTLQLMTGHNEFTATLQKLTFPLTVEEYLDLCHKRTAESVTDFAWYRGMGDPLSSG